MLYSCLFFFLFFVFILPGSSTSSISYHNHCASIIPELSQNVRFRDKFPLLQIATTIYNGGEKILGKKPSSDQHFFYTERSLSFQTTRKVYTTNQTDIYRLEAYLKLPTPRRTSTFGDSVISRDSVRFLLNGYWSESSGKLCMVGSASWTTEKGELLNLEAVLKLNYGGRNASIFTSLVSGTLKSLSSSTDPSFFEPISIYAFPELSNYNYSLVTKKFDEDLPGSIDVPKSKSLSLQPRSICDILSMFNTFELEYATGCASSKICNPLDGFSTYLPGIMSMYAIQCSADEQKLRYVMEFPNSSDISNYYYYPSDLNTTLLGEGSWDRGKNRLNIVACRILNSLQEPVQVGNCSVMLTLRFPATLTIRDTTRIIGQLWINDTVNDSGHFNMIRMRNTGSMSSTIPGLEYNYTEIENARKFCAVNKRAKRTTDKYPSAHSQDMRFDMSVKSSSVEFAWGSAIPNFVEEDIYNSYGIVYADGIRIVSEDEVSANENGPMNVSYTLSLNPFRGTKLANKLSSFNSSLGYTGRVEITAEGIYDAETGHLCMVGCRKLNLSIPNLAGNSIDCKIIVEFDFPPVNARNRGFVNGSIRSTRNSTDPLYFEVLGLTSNSFYIEEAKEFIWRMDLEIIMVLISSTLVCVFVALQIFHVKKHPEMLPSVSFVMLLVLTLGHLIPLVINFEAFFLENKKRRSMFFTRDGWLEVNEVIVRLVTLAAFLLMSRLLQLTWTARLGAEKGLWIAERKVLYISSSVYIAGGLIAVLIHYGEKPSLLGNLRCYAGLVVDGFLLPQILLNIFLNSRETVLSRAFYFGTTVVRLLPHAYDLYRIHKYSQYYYEGSYMYANPKADLYSTAWDVIISCGGILLAVIIFLQQKFGGRRILPQRFRELDLYEKVPTTISE